MKPMAGSIMKCVQEALSPPAVTKSTYINGIINLMVEKDFLDKNLVALNQVSPYGKPLICSKRSHPLQKTVLSYLIYPLYDELLRVPFWSLQVPKYWPWHFLNIYLKQIDILVPGTKRVKKYLVRFTVQKAVSEIAFGILPSLISIVMPRMKTPGKYISAAMVMFMVNLWRSYYFYSVCLKKIEKLTEVMAVYNWKMKIIFLQVKKGSCRNKKLLANHTEEEHFYDLQPDQIAELAKHEYPALKFALHGTTRRISVGYFEATRKLKCQLPVNLVADIPITSLPSLDDEDTYLERYLKGDLDICPPWIKLKTDVELMMECQSKFCKNLVLYALFNEGSASFLESLITPLLGLMVDSINVMEAAFLFFHDYENEPTPEGLFMNPSSQSFDLGTSHERNDISI